jgi:hypothetical protein
MSADSVCDYDHDSSDFDERYINESDSMSENELYEILSRYMKTAHGYHIVIEGPFSMPRYRSLFYKISTAVNYFVITEYVENDLGKYNVYHMYLFTNAPVTMTNRIKTLGNNISYEEWDKNIPETIDEWKNGPAHDWWVVEARQRKKYPIEPSASEIE